MIGYQKFICRDAYKTVDKFYPVGFYDPCVFSLVSNFPSLKPIYLMDHWKEAQNITQWKSVAKKISDNSEYFSPFQA